MNQMIIEKLKEKKNFVIHMKDGPNKTESMRKIHLIENMLQEEDWFMQIKMETGFSILEFLDIPEDHIIDIYFGLIDPKKIKKKELFIMDSKK